MGDRCLFIINENINFLVIPDASICVKKAVAVNKDSVATQVGTERQRHGSAE